MFEREFRETYKLERRCNAVKQFMLRYQTKVPVLVFRDPKATDIPLLARHKFIVPGDITMGEFMSEVRRHFISELHPGQGIFVFVNHDTLPSLQADMQTIYQRYGDIDDGFLYITYTGENSFGIIF